MPPATKASNKVQAKLGFTPVPEDSPQAQQLSPSVRGRASAVRYFSPKRDVSSSKGRTLPRISSRAKQQTLDFEQKQSRMSTRRLARSDGPRNRSDPIYASQKKSSPVSSRKLPSSSSFQRGDTPSPDQDVDELTAPSPRPQISRRKITTKVPKSSPPEPWLLDQDDSDAVVLVRGSRARPQVLDERDEDEVVPGNLPLSIQRNAQPTHLESGDDDSDFPILPVSTRRSTQLAKEAINPTNDDSQSEADSEEEQLALPSPSIRSLRSRVKRVINQDSEDDEEEPVITSSTRRSKRQASAKDQQIGSSSPIKRRRLQQGRPRQVERDERDQEVLDDVEDLKDSTTLVSEGLRSASTLNSAKAARQKQLAKLAAKRKGAQNSNMIDLSSSSESEVEAVPFPTPFSSIYRHGFDSYDEADEEDEDSLIDDEPITNGTTTNNNNQPLDLSTEPEELTIQRSIYDIPSALYYTIRHLLYTKFLPQPTNTKNDLYSTTSHTLLSKHLLSQSETFISSVWRLDFTTSLLGRPHLIFPRGELAIWESCEACGRRDRPASFVIRFEGPTYDAYALRDVDEDASTVVKRFGSIGEEGQLWHVGRDCADNAVRAHNAVHWRRSLEMEVGKALSLMGVVVDDAEDQDEGDEVDGDQNGDHAEAEEALLEKEDRYQAVLLQMEDQGYMQALQEEFLERYDLAGGSSGDSDDGY